MEYENMEQLEIIIDNLHKDGKLGDIITIRVDQNKLKRDPCKLCFLMALHTEAQYPKTGKLIYADYTFKGVPRGKLDLELKVVAVEQLYSNICCVLLQCKTNQIYEAFGSPIYEKNVWRVIRKFSGYRYYTDLRIINEHLYNHLPKI